MMRVLTFDEAMAFALELLEEPHGSPEKDERLARLMGWRRVEEAASKQGGSLTRWQPPAEDEPFGLCGTRNVANVLGWLVGRGWTVWSRPDCVRLPAVASVDFQATPRTGEPPRYHPLATPLAVCALFVLAPPQRTTTVWHRPHDRRLVVGPLA